jgi:polysaccharide export outer membrane protein
MSSHAISLALRVRPLPFTFAVLIFLAIPLKLTAHQETSAQRADAATPATPSQSSVPQSDRPALQHRDDRYRLCASDVVALTFPLTPEFDQTVNIQPDGFASLTGVGDVHLEGLTTAQSVDAIRTAYTRVLHDPIVTIELKTFNKPYFVVNGQVHQPGRYDLRGYTTATQAIAIAGGFEDSAKHSQVLLFRRVNNDWYEVKNLNLKRIMQGHDVNEDPEIRAGDMLVADSRSRFSRWPSAARRAALHPRSSFRSWWPGFRSSTQASRWFAGCAMPPRRSMGIAATGTTFCWPEDGRRGKWHWSPIRSQPRWAQLAGLVFDLIRSASGCWRL